MWGFVSPMKASLVREAVGDGVGVPAAGWDGVLIFPFSWIGPLA